MANISMADVTIEAKGCAIELLEYIDAAQGDDECNIISPEEVRNNLPALKRNGLNDIEISGSASGRWSYSANLEKYFAGMLAEYSWRYNDEAHLSFGRLIAKLKRNKEAQFEITFKDIEQGVGFLCEGSLFVGEASDLSGSEQAYVEVNDLDYTLENVKEAFGYSDYEAMDAIYGDDIADAYVEYVDEGGKLSPEEFYDKYSDEIYNGDWMGGAKVVSEEDSDEGEEQR